MGGGVRGPQNLYGGFYGVGRGAGGLFKVLEGGYVCREGGLGGSLRSWKGDMMCVWGWGGLEVSLRSWKVTWEHVGGYGDDPKVFMVGLLWGWRTP